MPFDFPFHHSGAAARGICRGLLVGAALSVASAATAEEKGQGGAPGVQPASPTVNVPVLDIRANIMRRLRQRGQRQGGEPPAPQAGSEPPAAEAPPDEPVVAKPEKAPEPAEPQEAVRPAPAPETGKETGQMASPEPDGARESNHVPVPEKTLTIRQLRDVDRLADELDRAHRQKENGGG